MNKKESCVICGKEAVWVYMPQEDSYYCDDCISNKDDIGCSCNWENINENRLYSNGKDLSDHLPKGIENINWRWVEQSKESNGVEVTKEDGYWISLDDRQRPYPCCEYEYSKNGFFTQEYENFLVCECDRIGYNLSNDELAKKDIEKFGHIIWTDDIIERIGKIIEEIKIDEIYRQKH